MKKTILGILLTMVTMASAQEPLFAPAWTDSCVMVSRVMDLPSYYCPCKEASSPFAFPVVSEIFDTVWYSASIADLSQGVSAYWFADCSIRMDVFAFCTSTVPTFSLTVGPNQMRDIDTEKINKKLGELTDQQKIMVGQMEAHIRIYPLNGGSGQVYCYPYNQGPLSECDNPVPLYSGMTYVCSEPENVYRMEWAKIPSSGKAFVHWLQKKNEPCEIWLTLDSCAGEQIGGAELSDSLHVYVPDSAKLVDARKAKRSLWLHVKHKNGVVGRIHWFNNPKYAEPLEPSTKTVCLGKTITIDMRTYSNDTVFNDTLWVNRDSLVTRQLNYTFTQPKMEYDTISPTQSQLARGYLYKPSGSVFYEYGDTIVDVEKENTCTRRIQVTIKAIEGMDYVGASNKRSCKYMQNGQLFILVDDRKYNVLGQEQR